MADLEGALAPLTERERLDRDLAERHLSGLWTRHMSPEPAPATQAYLWRWSTIEPLAKRALDLLTLGEGGDGARRAIQFCNPGLPAGTTPTLFGAYQYLNPGETAPAHRHAAGAIRFMMAGSGIFTTVDGDACEMTPGDLILTPSWTWHDHTSYGDDPVVWFDGIDAPLVASLECWLAENHPEGMQKIVGRGLSETSFAGTGLYERLSPGSETPPELMRFSYAAADRALDAILAAKGGPIATIEYRNPMNGRPAITTMTCLMMRILPGGRRAPRRQTGSQVHVVYRGRGKSVIGGTQFDWGAGDVFVVPSWAPVEHESEEVADIFVVTDQAALELLGLFREQQLSEPQRVAGRFEPL